MNIMFFHVISYSIVTLIGYYFLGLTFPKHWPLAYTEDIGGIISGLVGILVPVMGSVVLKK